MCHPSQSRPLSVHECARLQGFTDDWLIQGSVAHQYLQIGNAVPVALGRAIGLSLNQIRPLVEDIDHNLMLDAAIKRLRAAARNNRGKVKSGATSSSIKV
jgi:DNA (cytosine-5)-methyltransferase 1